MSYSRGILQPFITDRGKDLKESLGGERKTWLLTLDHLRFVHIQVYTHTHVNRHTLTNRLRAPQTENFYLLGPLSETGGHVSAV